ncbi:MAG: proline--tRNA ligase [Nanoarchaeota archaeon]
MDKKNNLGITVKKEEDFSEWYTQLIQKADLADYSSVSGCIVYKPASYAIWEKIQSEVDKRFKQIGIQNAYFPLFIPESLLQKEATHIAHFSPEVAWVTHGGDTKLGERLAVRPTSETIMYESYAKWIRSHNDLPLRLNQWNNVVRWEFKHPTPFLRGREFLWNEGHTCFASQKEALAEQEEIISIYDEVCRNYLALPSLIGKKSEGEKFAGAEYTVSLEFLMPNGKGIQGPDFHHDGQNFAKVFNITFANKTGQQEHVWQNTFAITTRMLGVLFAIHSDDKGLVLPPMLAPVQAVIIPILFGDSKEKILLEAEKLKKKLEKSGILVYLDNRESYSSGWKFSEWEMKGIPIRIELGPRDLAKKQIVVVRRDTGEKQSLSILTADKKLASLLKQIQADLYAKAEKSLKKSIVKVDALAGSEKELDAKKILFAPWCNSAECEELIKEKTGAKSLNSPLKQPAVTGKCFACDKKAKAWFYFGRSY